MRAHAFFLCALTAGVVIRGVVAYAYRPALLFTDSFAYMSAARHLTFLPNRPIGYSFFLRPFLLSFNDLAHALTTVQVVQHLVGLALAVVVYCFLRRRGLPGWGATLATLPLLLDPLELVLEHYVLSDLLFSAILVLAVVVMSWSHRPSWTAILIAGVLIGVATLVRGAGTLLALGFVVALIFLRVPWRRVIVFLIAFVIPVAAYAAAFEHQNGEFATTTAGQFFLYARIAPIVDCHDPQLNVTKQQRLLCPRGPASRRHDTNYYMWNTAHSPLYSVAPPNGLTRRQFVGRFNKSVIRSQPLRLATAALKDFLRGFWPVRTSQGPGYPASAWLFADHYWTWDGFATIGINDPILQQVSAEPSGARFMAHYREYVYLPGPLAGGLLLVAMIAALGFGRARRCGDRVVIGLLVGSCLLTLLTGAALSGFSWRYELPQLSMLPMAGALGIAALLRGPAPGKPSPQPPLRPLDRGAEVLRRLPLPARGRMLLDRATAAGRTQWFVAIVLGLGTALLVTVGGLASGYLRLSFAGAIGLSTGAVATLLLLVGRARLVREEASASRRSEVMAK